MMNDKGLSRGALAFCDPDTALVPGLKIGQAG
jgi:hypothetical protein